MSAFVGSIYDHAGGQFSSAGRSAISVTAQARTGTVRVTLLGENKDDPTVVITVTAGHASLPRREVFRSRLSTLLSTPHLIAPSERDPADSQSRQS